MNCAMFSFVQLLTCREILFKTSQKIAEPASVLQQQQRQIIVSATRLMPNAWNNARRHEKCEIAKNVLLISENCRLGTHKSTVALGYCKL